MRFFVLVLCSLLSSVPAFGECYKTDIGTCAIEKAMLDATNAFRAKNGLPPLEYRRELAFAARAWSDEMAASATIGHAGFPAARNASIQAEFPGSPARVHGENVAYFLGHKPASIGGYFVELWIGSTGHRENILRPFRYVGMGYSRRNGAHFATQAFAW